MSLAIDTESVVPDFQALPTAEMEGSRLEPLDPVRLRRVKKAYTTRFLAEELELSVSIYQVAT